MTKELEGELELEPVKEKEKVVSLQPTFKTLREKNNWDKFVKRLSLVNLDLLKKQLDLAKKKGNVAYAKLLQDELDKRSKN